MDNRKYCSACGATERFDMPTGKQIIDIAVLFNDGKLDIEQLTNMVSMCQFVLDRLHENGDILTPAASETDTQKRS